MVRNLLLVILVAMIFTLLLPITAKFYATEQAFTPDNLVQVDSVYR